MIQLMAIIKHSNNKIQAYCPSNTKDKYLLQVYLMLKKLVKKILQGKGMQIFKEVRASNLKYYLLNDQDLKLTLKNKKCMQEIIKYTQNKIVKIPKKTPLISIIILNKDGLNHLKRLFKALKNNTYYPNFEIIIIDNASTDNSLAYLDSNPYQLNLNLVKNTKNVSFSKGNNQAAKIANGDYLLLLNNDIEPTKGWLCEMVQTILKEDSIGSVGAKLIYPYKTNFQNSCTIQHAGIAFKYEKDFIRPYNIGIGKNPINNYHVNSSHIAITAACLLISKELFNEVGGLDEAYYYGYEDVDLGLKLLSQGYKNVLCSSSISFHYEFGTQDKEPIKEIRKRRSNNIAIFKQKWQHFIKKNYWQEKVRNLPALFSEKPLTIALAVTDTGENATEGDFFTAQELKSKLENFGYMIIFLRQKKNEWYHFSEEVDILISLLEVFDLRNLPMHQKKIITIAWARNWFDQWLKNGSFKRYDFVFASSQKACDYISRHSNKKAMLMPLATNNKVSDCSKSNDFIRTKTILYQCDYCFTGSYWGYNREIIDFLNPQRLSNYTFKIFGQNWEQVDKLKKYNQGFAAYTQMKFIYCNTKIVIDDANHVTKPYGSVNSRVFDALACGALVLTNGKLGSELLFDGKLPHFSTEDELYTLLSFYLENTQARIDKINELQQLVIQKHTYKHRAVQIKNLLENYYTKTSIAIKIPAPNWQEVEQWGDYHFGLALKKEFEKLGYFVLLQVLNEWHNQAGDRCDIVLVLRGLTQYTPKAHQINLMWNISHPDKVSIKEYNKYDHIFIASQIWAAKIANEANVSVDTMLQCTDNDLFFADIPNHLSQNEEIINSHKYELLFIGNSRKIYRQIIKDILPTPYTLSLYGTHWEEFVDSSMIKGTHIANKELLHYYTNTDILLNDHWLDMREKGFISNRLFDALACGAFVISDEVKGMDEILNKSIVTYKNKTDLQEKVDFYMKNPAKRAEITAQGIKFITENHTFKHRAKQFSNIIQNHLNRTKYKQTSVYFD